MVFDSKEIITKDDLVNHFNKSLPEIKETKLGGDRIHLIQNEHICTILLIQPFQQPGQILEMKFPTGHYNPI
jgi:hypothetical protein